MGIGGGSKGLIYKVENVLKIFRFCVYIKIKLRFDVYIIVFFDLGFRSFLKEV